MTIPDTHPEFPQLEIDILQWWEKNNISRKYIEKNRNSDKSFRFLDGPITANNPMGVHHAHGRTLKDFFQRFKNMQGYQQRFQNGFDCQGLWVEVEEEKDLGFNSKSDIENFGIDKFCISCSNRVTKYSQVQVDQSKRLGMFMDWDNSYYTMSENNNLHIWHFLKEVDKKGWLYKGIDAMPWCARCGTAISQHELSDGGYKDVNHETVYVNFPLTNHTVHSFRSKFALTKDQQVCLLIWTTTPWTLLANVAVAVNPDLEYQIVDVDDQYLILAAERRNVLENPGSVEASFTGKELVQFFQDFNESIYAGPYDQLEAPKQVTHKLILWDEVSSTEGTGLVHIAPGAGKEDFELHKTNELDLLSPIDEFGNYEQGYGVYTGQNVAHVRGKIIKELTDNHFLYKTESIRHSYPHCWRCKQELVFRTTNEWFIKSDEVRPLMKKAAAEVNWMPEFAGKRMQDWLDNMGDWPISRKRYWGLALPFFESSDKSEYYVVGSKEDLRQLAKDPSMVDKLKELHRPWIDAIEIVSPKTGNVLTRVTDVGDCWLDAGITPFSTVDYLQDKEHWQAWYPFDFITEYVAQIKLWFYSTLFMSVTLENKAPWKNVLATGFLVDEKGDAMHKSSGNAIAFDEAAQKAGADAIRWLYLRERSANYHGTGNLRFGYNILNDVRRRFFDILWNSYRFIIQNAVIDDWSPTDFDPAYKSENILDQWITSRWNSVLKQSLESIEVFDTTTAAAAIESFVVNDFSQWYIRRSRGRVGPTANNSQAKSDFYQTSYQVLLSLIKTIAPFAPFVSELIYSNIRTNHMAESVHLDDYPEIDDTLINAELEAEMAKLRIDAELVHSLRKTHQVPLRQPLSSLTITNGYTFDPDHLKMVLSEEVNVLRIDETDDIPEAENVLARGERKVALDLTITEQLRQAGMIRDVIRSIQSLRGEAKYSYDQPIRIVITTNSTHVANFVAESTEQFKQKLLAEEIVFVDDVVVGDVVGKIEIDGQTATVILQKV